MNPVDHDVYIGCHTGEDSTLAGQIAADLTRRGFRVATGSGGPADATGEGAADFVLLLGPGTLPAMLGDAHDPLRLALARAFADDRNVIPVVLKGHLEPAPGSLPADIRKLDRCHPLPFEPTKAAESIARLSHRLSSHATLDDRQSTRQAKGLGWLVGVFVLAVIAVGGYRTWKDWQKPILDVRPLPPFVVYWTAFGQRQQNGQWAELALDERSRVSAGDQFKLIFTPNADGYAYVVCRDTKGMVTVLFPPKSLGGASRVKAGQMYEAPVGSGWASVDAGADLDALYLVAGYDPLENLESLLEEHPEESTPQARQTLLESTIGGLLDGRHAMAGPVVRTRSGRPIVLMPEAGPAATAASATLSSGARVTHNLAPQRGLQSTAVEIHSLR